MSTLPYNSYLLRLWQNSPAEDGWCYSLEDPRTGARRGFAKLDDLVAFLQQETTHPSSHASPDPESTIRQSDE